MPGSGTIGGGRSCVVDIDIIEGGHKRKCTDTDKDATYPFVLGFRFPVGTTMQGNIVLVPILSEDDKVSVFWK